MFKKVLAIMLVFCLCFAFAGCGKKDSSGTVEEEGESGQFTVLSNKPDDWDSNWTAYYEMDADGNPVKLTGDTAPEFVAGKYLAKGAVQKTKSDSGDTAATDSAAADGQEGGQGDSANGGNAAAQESDNGGNTTATDSGNGGNTTATDSGNAGAQTGNNGGNTTATDSGNAGNSGGNTTTTASGNAGTQTGNNGGNTTTTDSGNAGNGGGNTATTASTGTGTQAGNNQGSGTNTASTKFAADPFSDIPASVKGTTVEYLFCRAITDNDKALIASFEQKTGIKVKLTYAEYGSYGDTVANRVAAGNAPDLINGERVAYPNGLISLCEPMDKYTFRLEDDFWDYDSMSGAKIRGEYYGVNSKKSIYHDARMMMINVPLLKKILGADYTSKSPRALWKAGKWDLEALYDLCTTIKDKGYMPLTYISQYDFALASGQDLVSFNGTKFSSNLSNTDLRKSWEWISKFLNSEGYMETYNQNNFLAQKDVMFINTVYNCYNKNSIAGMASFEVDAVPVPGLKGVTSAPCDFRTYSIAKGAKNKVGTAYFLRYLLDNETYNPYEKSEATNANVWETAVYVSQKMPKTMEFSSSLLKYVSDTAEGQVRTTLLTSNQMSTAFAKIENQVNNAVKRVNKSVLKVE